MPCSRSSFTAFALRPPILQWTMMSGASATCGISARRFGSSPSGISVDPGIRQIWNSCGSRTSRMHVGCAAVDRAPSDPRRSFRAPPAADGAADAAGRMPQNCS